MTTPDTSAVRAWARENGMAVADRGRLPAELRAAYLAAQGSAAPAEPEAGGRSARKAAPATKPAKTAKAARKAPAAKAPARAAAPVEAPVEQPVDEPVEQPSPDEQTAARLVALEEQVAALVARVARLEQPAPAKTPRFRRRA